MECYDITKVDIFSLQTDKRGDLPNLLSILVFLYSKFHGDPVISFKYSEIDWMYYNKIPLRINKLHELDLLTIISKPTKQDPFVIRLKPNNELHYILNKNKRIEFKKYDSLTFNRKNFQKAINCGSLREHFIGDAVSSWVRNVNNQVWDLQRFLVITKIVSHFACDYKVKTFTVNKYNSRKLPFNKSVTFLYEKIPDNRKEIIYSQFNNTCIELNLKHDKSFIGMVTAYLEYTGK
jgi:hypothetical protein